MGKPLTTDQQAEVVRWMPTARSMASVYVKRVPRLKDDIFAAANLAACKAVQQYRPGTSNAQFASYLWSKVRGEIGTLFDREMLGRWKCRIEWEADNALAWHADQRQSQRLNEVEEAEAFASRIACLPDLDQRILSLQFIDGMYQREIGSIVGLHRCNVNQRAQAALALIRQQSIL